MKKTCVLGLLVLLNCIALFPVASSAGDARRTPQISKSIAGTVFSPTAVRSSPYSPPTTDAFVTDASPGLDTGCTFRSGGPLVVDVIVDSFAGDVDANGNLVNPGPLIAKGIIPSTVRLEMPAFDIDFNGQPPPERDEVVFNGQSLGFLTGCKLVDGRNEMEPINTDDKA